MKNGAGKSIYQELEIALKKSALANLGINIPKSVYVRFSERYG